MSLTLGRDQSLVTPCNVVKQYMAFLEAVDTPVALKVHMLLRAGEFEQVAGLKIDPKNYNDASAFRLDYQAVSGLRKASFLNTNIDKRQAALDAFEKAEIKCRATNLRFDDLMYGGGAAKLLLDDPEMFGALSSAANLISRILGPVPKDLERRFGPGVTSVVKLDVTLPKKYASKVDATTLLYRSSLSIMGPRWASDAPAILEAEGSSIAFVPKDSLTDRTIGIEPHLNGYQQLGYGLAIRERFKPWVNLQSGQEVNRFLASVAHEWDLSTIDLSSASDTISRSLVWFLLPEEWATALDTCRSHNYRLNGKWSEFEKFSSMGCGFTFELESIIFYALARACGSHRALTSTYGDDIICETAVFDRLQKTLEYCGFTVNWNKSFRKSAFYESCGADFFLGQNVRPFFWKENKPSLLFKMCNDVSRFARLANGRDVRYRKVFNSTYNLLTKEAKTCLIPDGMGDVGVVVDFDVAQPFVRRLPNGWCGFRTKALKFKPVYHNHSLDEGGLRSVLDRPLRGSPRWIDNLFPEQNTPVSETSIRNKGWYQVGPVTTFASWQGYGPWVSGV